MSTYGLMQVHNGENAKVDVVFLHGLRGDREKTWTQDGVLWPKDLLPQDIPESRIFLFGYDTGITHRDQSSVTKTEIHSDAEDLCAKLAAERSSTGTEDRPIIFIAHSLGGLVAAQILVHGEQRSEDSRTKSITKNLRGMIFLGTPFRGSSAAKPAEIARRILDFFGIDTQQHTLKLLGVDSERLDELTRAFPNVLNKRRTSKDPKDRIEAFFFYETLETGWGKGLIQIVDVDSAQLPGCGDAAPISADHVKICKFKTAKDEGYSVVVAAVRKVMLPPDALSSQPSTKIINILGKAVNVGDIINIASQQITM
ncbi:hypothetical protein FOVG_18861 [Fusarium oxysporum f. sp. pisi HDV247]|uniref:DUF676 domain-containing protein n=1 Tax=Fusarium oxysporum f. sp. pisi HDV247 TaxID=1080344 RepID=W9NPA4_FUSOX|nr:hypothetical protein FOVG_18861 [Fusarium oxysporum f. sp. pisi HDV247]